MYIYPTTSLRETLDDADRLAFARITRAAVPPTEHGSEAAAGAPSLPDVADLLRGFEVRNDVVTSGDCLSNDV
jgi:hypothetical protein